jgi:protein SCO1/2
MSHTIPKPTVTWAATLLAAAALGAALTGCGGSGRSGSTANRSAASANPTATVANRSASTANRSDTSRRGVLEGGLIVHPTVKAPPLALDNYTGKPVSIATMRGKVVFVTFVYTHCKDVCPLIVSNLAAAQRLLGSAAHNVRFVAVTVDPKRDTASVVKKFLTVRDALGLDYLIGHVSQLDPVWKAWHIQVTLNKQGIVTGHSAFVYGVTPGGRIAIVLPSNFTAAQIVHDAPILERS